MTTYEFFNQGWVSLVATIIIALLSFILGKRHVAKPTFLLNGSRELTWGKLPDIPAFFELTFHEKPIKRISRGVLRFWNDGNATLEGTMVPATDRLRLELPDGEFLLVGTPRQTKSANGCSIELDENDQKVAYISFDYLDPKEGALFGFIHTSTEVSPAIKGTIKGHRVKFLESGNSPFLTKFTRKTKRFLPWMVLVSGFLTLAAGTFTMGFQPIWQGSNVEAISLKAQQDALRVGIGLTFAGAIYAMAGFGLLWFRRRRYPKELQIVKSTESGSDESVSGESQEPVVKA